MIQAPEMSGEDATRYIGGTQRNVVTSSNRKYDATKQGGHHDHSAAMRTKRRTKGHATRYASKERGDCQEYAF
jgi:hypothetical protein